MRRRGTGVLVALGFGRLAVVQPLLVASVVFALPLGARLTGQKVKPIDIGAALLVTAALVAFLTFADPSGGRADAPLGDWLIAIGGNSCIWSCALCIAMPICFRLFTHCARRVTAVGPLKAINDCRARDGSRISRKRRGPG